MPKYRYVSGKKNLLIELRHRVSLTLYIKTHAYSIAMLCQNFKAIGEELSDLLDFEQTNTYIFII
jgi:hypothetical protein